MDKNTLHLLIDRYIDGTASQEERLLLDEYADQLANTGIMTMTTEEKLRLKEEMHRNILMQLDEREAKVVPLVRRTLFRAAAAAVIVLMVAGGVYFAFFKGNSGQSPADKVQAKQPDIAPGTNGAVLTLADGSIVIVDSAGNGVLANQGATKVVKLSDGQLAYEVNGKQTEILFNTLRTDRGKQFHVRLPDGTDVWLNSASSLRYPTAFVGKERKVEVTGEAYFEVAKNPSMPFIVSSKGQDIRVLGTHFNVNAYDDENAIRTTLLEGSVKVTTAGKQTLLKPGEQAIAAANDIKVQGVNVNDVVAWKNGFFAFRGTDVKGIMRQISRWYDVDVVYQGVDPHETFTGKIDRNLTLSQVLKGLEETKLRYRIENGKKLVILP